jgi:predicted nucleic acid-binding protein
VSVFFDTNVLVYCTDKTELQKQSKARALVAQYGSLGQAVVSSQVLIELFNVLTRQQLMPPELAQTLTLAYARWSVIQSDVAQVSQAIDKSIQYRMSIWDAMVIEAAVQSGAETLYTENLTHGQRIGKLSVINPFLS